MDFKLPELGEGVYEAEVSRWLIAEGAQVKPGQGLLEVLTDKATMEVPAPFAGTVTAFKVRDGEKIKVGEPVLTYEESDKAAASSAADTAAPVASVSSAASAAISQPATSNGPSRASVTSGAVATKAAPSVRLMARKLGVDLGQVRGSGPAGRILVEDLAQFVQPAAASGRQSAPAERPDYGRPGTRVKLQGLRRKIAEHMVHAKTTVPHYTYVDECDVTDLVKLRDSLRDSTTAQGVKLTYLAFFVKAVAGALRDVPLVNASLDEAAGEIVLHDKYHIGIAVNTPQGLIVPVIHDADRLSLLDVAREIERLTNDARAGKAKLDSLRGGTFTITSIGNIGGLFATPIIHQLQVGILGVGKIVKRPVYDKLGQIHPADMLYLSFSFDHRVLDGAIGAAFGNAVIDRLRRPGVLILDL